MQTEIDPPTDSPQNWRWDESGAEEPRDEFADDDDFGDLDELSRPLEPKGPTHSPPEILRALAMWSELDEDEFNDFEDDDFDEEFDDDFEEELEDEYEELEDDFDDEEELEEDLDEGFEDIEGDEDGLATDLPPDDDEELEELDEE